MRTAHVRLDTMSAKAKAAATTKAYTHTQSTQHTSVEQATLSTLILNGMTSSKMIRFLLLLSEHILFDSFGTIWKLDRYVFVRLNRRHNLQ